MVHSYGDRHHLTAVFITKLSSVDNWLVVQITIRKFHIQRIVGDPWNERGVEPIWMSGRVKMKFWVSFGMFNILQTCVVKRMNNR